MLKVGRGCLEQDVRLDSAQKIERRHPSVTDRREGGDAAPFRLGLRDRVEIETVRTERRSSRIRDSDDGERKTIPIADEVATGAGDLEETSADVAEAGEYDSHQGVYLIRASMWSRPQSSSSARGERRNPLASLRHGLINGSTRDR